MNKRTFLRTLGLFSILPGAGRVWKAVRAEPTCEIRYLRAWGFVHGPDGLQSVAYQVVMQPVSRLIATSAPTEAYLRELYFGVSARFDNLPDGIRMGALPA